MWNYILRRIHPVEEEAEQAYNNNIMRSTIWRRHIFIYTSMVTIFYSYLLLRFSTSGAFGDAVYMNIIYLKIV